MLLVPYGKGAYVIGVDVGQAGDPTACVVDEITAPRPFRHVVRDVIRFKLGMPYREMARQIALYSVLKPISDKPRVIVVDYTGCGRGFVEMLINEIAQSEPQSDRRPPVIGITITGGLEANQGKPNNVVQFSWNVPKRDMVFTGQAVFQDGRLKIAKSIELGQLLADELRNLKPTKTTAGNDTVGVWREGEHDDVALALLTATWYAERVARAVGIRSENVKASQSKVPLYAVLK
jgi:hypothetical protein